MENFPVEVIGNILSRLNAARDVVIASTACKKWREACKYYLRALSFDSNDWPEYGDLTTSQIEILITQTIFQTRGLQSLSISMKNVNEFSAAPVIAWLMYTRETLCRLCFNVKTKPSINILDKVGKLAVLDLTRTRIISVDPSYQRFPCLKSLSLTHVIISAMDLELLLTGCPIIETLKLINPDMGLHENMVVNSSSLKEIHIESVSGENCILQADNLETLNLIDCILEVFQLISEGKLKFLKVDDVNVSNIDFGDNTNLETVDVSNFAINWTRLYQMISNSSNLRKLRMWGVVFEDEETIDVQRIAVAFPHLTHLSLSCLLGDLVFAHALQGTSPLENVTVLELGWTVIDGLFSKWVAAFVERCPKLKKLVIYGFISRVKRDEDCRFIADFSTSIVHLMRRYTNVDIQFEYE